MLNYSWIKIASVLISLPKLNIYQKIIVKVGVEKKKRKKSKKKEGKKLGTRSRESGRGREGGGLQL